MGSRLIQALLALSLLLNTFVIAGFVFRGWIAPPPPPFEHAPPPLPPGAGPRPSPIDMVMHEVGLSEAQRQALQPALDTYAAGRRERGREIAKLREQVSDAYRRLPLDPSRIDPLIDRLTVLRGDQQKDTLRTLVQIEQKLASEQRERFHRILADRLVGPPPRPGGPGGPGGRPGGPPPGPPMD